MADEAQGSNEDMSQAFLAHLESSGFFKQIKDLESNLTTIAGELQAFAKVSRQRMEETENLAAHVLAIESLLAIMLKKADVSVEEVTAEVKERTAAISGNPEGSAAVHKIATDLLARAGDTAG